MLSCNTRVNGGDRRMAPAFSRFSYRSCLRGIRWSVIEQDV